MAHTTTLDGLSGNCESRLRRAAARTYLEIRRHVNDKILICKPITVILGKDSQSIRQMQYCPFIFDFVFPLEKRVKAAHTFSRRGDFKGAMSKFRKKGAMTPDALPAGERVRTAVALRYEPVDENTAPKVVASGRGWIAERILEAAFAHGIRVREDADLAEILAAVDLDEEIPVEAFIAVAEILRYVYAANGTQPPEVSSR